MEAYTNDSLVNHFSNPILRCAIIRAIKGHKFLKKYIDWKKLQLRYFPISQLHNHTQKLHTYAHIYAYIFLYSQHKNQSLLSAHRWNSFSLTLAHAQFPFSVHLMLIEILAAGSKNKS